MEGAARRPDLTGRVTAKLVLDPTGAVEDAADEGSDLPDPRVVACVLDVMRTAHFAPPRGGGLTLVYPVVFKPETSAVTPPR
jgi:TonB family protein